MCVFLAEIFTMFADGVMMISRMFFFFFFLWKGESGKRVLNLNKKISEIEFCRQL